MCVLAAVCIHSHHFVFWILVLADVRRAITHKHSEGCVSISALFYLDFLSVANIICVHAFSLAVNCASPQSVFAKFSQGFAVSGVKGASPGMEHSGCMTVFKQHGYRRHASRPLGGKAVRKLHISRFCYMYTFEMIATA